MNSMQTGFDWEKNKPYQIKKRGNLSLLAATTFKNGNMVSSGSRCVWPSASERAPSVVLSARLPDNFAPRMG